MIFSPLLMKTIAEIEEVSAIPSTLSAYACQLLERKDLATAITEYPEKLGNKALSASSWKKVKLYTAGTQTASFQSRIVKKLCIQSERMWWLVVALCSCRKVRSGYFYDIVFTPKYDGSYKGDHLLPVESDPSDENVRVLTRLIKRYVRENRRREVVRRAQSEVLRDFSDSLRSLLRYNKGYAKYKKQLRRADLIRRRYRTDPLIDKFIGFESRGLQKQRQAVEGMARKTGKAIRSVGSLLKSGLSSLFG